MRPLKVLTKNYVSEFTFSLELISCLQLVYTASAYAIWQTIIQ